MEMQQIIESWQKCKMNAETKAIQAKMKAMRDKRMEANMNDGRKERTACHEATEADTKTEPEPGMM
jgi:Spy/CpxP family protein refolding chaperone